VVVVYRWLLFGGGHKLKFDCTYIRNLGGRWGFTKLLMQIRKIFVNLGLNILRLFRLKVLFEADIIKG